MPTADLVVSGTVLTVDELRSTAEALAVSDGRIVAVGKRSEIDNMVVLSADPRAVPPEAIADLEVRATFLAGRQVYSKDF